MKKIFSVLCVLSLLFGCKESPNEPQNSLPKIESLTAYPNTVLINTETTLTCVATDEDGDNLMISWLAKRGIFPIGVVGSSVRWIAPLTVGKDTIIVFIHDGKQTVQGKLEIIVGTVPTSLTLSMPANNSTEVSVPPTLTWNALSNTDSYTLQVSTSNSFSSFIYNQSGLTGTSQLISGLTNNTPYYWRVRASNSYGTSGWSSFWSFTTAVSFVCGTQINYLGKTYNTVQVGSQCWLKENLDVGTMIQGNQHPSINGTIEKYCYNNDPANCTTYGGLYQWNEAMAYSHTPGTQGICPSGWHIPIRSELHTLTYTVRGIGNDLKAIGQGTGIGAGTNATGFSALIAGCHDINGTFNLLGSYTLFWSSTDNNTNNAYNMFMYSYNSDITFNNKDKAYGLSVRCLKD